MTRCTGAGVNGSHCCWVNGVECPLLTHHAGVPRCSVWGEWDKPAYQESAVFAAYEKQWPGKGYTCSDWPQNIPEAMAGRGRCCWETD